MSMAPRAKSAPAENNRRQTETGPLDAPQPVQSSSTPFTPLSRLDPTKRKRWQDSEAEVKGVHHLKQPQEISPPRRSEEALKEADKPEGMRHSKEPQELSPHPPSVQPSPTSAPIPQLTGTKRKRLQNPEAEAEADELKDVRPSKQSRELPPSELPEEILPKDSEAEAKIDDPEGVYPSEQPQGILPLSEVDLHALYEEVMAVPANRPNSVSIKRSLSQRSSTAESKVTQDTTPTKDGYGTNGRYRFRFLAPAQVKFHADPPPKNIQDAIDAIVYAKPPVGRREQLEPIARKFQARCIQLTRSSFTENEYVKMLHDALEAMRFDILCLCSNDEWNAQLKPKILRSSVIMDYQRFNAGRQQQQVDDISTPPQAKRQQQAVGQPYISPQPSMANETDPLPVNGPQESTKVPPLAPPPVPVMKGTIKTPRPDITIGLALGALASALSTQGLDETNALLFLDDLQRVMESREPGGPEEPMLISVPVPSVVDLVFPFGVDEGKAYLTGKQISEAENQAAGAGACALNMQLRLDELVKKDLPLTSPDSLPAPSEDQSRKPPPSSEDQPPKLPPPSEDQIPLFFPICTEGPLHMLWVQWTEVKNGTRQYNMMPLKCVYAVLPDGLVDFFVMLDNVLRWGTGHFLESLVMRLGKVKRNFEQGA